MLAPPRRERPAPRDLTRYVSWLRSQAADHDLTVLDLSSHPVIPEQDFRDSGHLSPAGAEKLSRLLGHAFAACAADWVVAHADEMWPEV